MPKDICVACFKGIWSDSLADIYSLCFKWLHCLYYPYCLEKLTIDTRQIRCRNYISSVSGILRMKITVGMRITFRNSLSNKRNTWDRCFYLLLNSWSGLTMMCSRIKDRNTYTALQWSSNKGVKSWCYIVFRKRDHPSWWLEGNTF